MKRSLSEIPRGISEAVPRAGHAQPLGLTRRQKRLLVGGRLAEPDAGDLSDRAIARELSVSQPFVSAMRRRAGLTGSRRHRRRAKDFDALADSAAAALLESNACRPVPSAGECFRPTSAQEWLDRNHDECSPMGRVRRIAWPASWNGSRADSDGDPYERG